MATGISLIFDARIFSESSVVEQPLVICCGLELHLDILLLYCSQLWVEAEGDGDHQAHHKRNADVTEGSNQQRVPLEKSSSP